MGLGKSIRWPGLGLHSSSTTYSHVTLEAKGLLEPVPCPVTLGCYPPQRAAERTMKYTASGT